MSRPLAPRNPALPIYDDGDYAPGSREWAQRQQGTQPVSAQVQALRIALANCDLRESEIDVITAEVLRRCGITP